MTATERREEAETVADVPMVLALTPDVAVGDREYQPAEADVPAGWELLPAMPGRTIRANREYLNYPNRRRKHAPWKVSDGTAADVFAYDVRPVGEVRFMVGVAVDELGCSVGTAWVETDAPILVRWV